jgi:hypothetical protein
LRLSKGNKAPFLSRTASAQTTVTGSIRTIGLVTILMLFLMTAFGEPRRGFLLNKQMRLISFVTDLRQLWQCRQSRNFSNAPAASSSESADQHCKQKITKVDEGNAQLQIHG